MMMIRARKILLPVFVLAGLSACAPTFEARVARFQQMPPPAAAQSFAIEPRDKDNVGGLEFATYANLVRQRLLANGYTEAVTPEQAAMTVQLDYMVGPPREEVRSRPGYGGAWGGGFGGWGSGFGGTRFGGWGWNPYWGGGFGGWGGGFGGWGGGPEIYSVTQYNSTVALKIMRTGDKTSVFEGRAETVSSSNNLTRIVPNLVTAIFTNFPGNSGETVRVKFDPARPDVAPTVKPAG